MSEPEITVAFLDVGQGDSAVIILPDQSSAIVVDCFRDSVAIDYLEEKGINILSYVFLTHTDLDHIGGVLGLLENFGQVDGIGYNHDTPKIITGKRRSILQHLVQLVRMRDLKVCSPRSGQSWTFQGVVVDVLHPDDLDTKEAELSGDTNNASVMLRATFAGRRVLFPKTLELLRSYPRLRFVCTEATPKCHGSLKTEKGVCRCGGTIEVIIGNNRIEVTPDHVQHSEVIKYFDTPQCK
jgi:competence protein ComEC